MGRRRRACELLRARVPTGISPLLLLRCRTLREYAGSAEEEMEVRDAGVSALVVG